MPNTLYYDYSGSTLSPSEYNAVQEVANALPESFYIWFLIAGILALVGGILVYFLFVKPKTSPKGKFALWLKNFLSFKIMWLEPILKIAYYVLTIGCILVSFGFLGYGVYGILLFFVTLIGGPIIIRLGYEMTMMFVMIWHNTQVLADHAEKKK
ncbi:hypothetical protein IKG60_00295 [Candidatus Saccharibacteria bacterium]|nr:hypothetical protein [Candidatus Saccharibacteria bacterium]